MAVVTKQSAAVLNAPPQNYILLELRQIESEIDAKERDIAALVAKRRALLGIKKGASNMYQKAVSPEERAAKWELLRK